MKQGQFCVLVWLNIASNSGLMVQEGIRLKPNQRRTTVLE
jgi:hypothetical protein